MNYSISVLVTCHNRKEKTLLCLRTLYGQMAEINMAVYLVDDGSTDGTSTVVSGEYPQVRVIPGSGNLCWAKGMHLAWDTAEKAGSYDFFLWLNDDVELHSDAIKLALRDWESLKNPAAVVVGACGVAERCTYGATDSGDGKVVPNGKPQRAEGWLNGNLVLVSRRAYEIVGKICSDYTHARADYDYSERLRKSKVPFFSTSSYVGACPYDFESKVRGKGLLTRIS